MNAVRFFQRMVVQQAQKLFKLHQEIDDRVASIRNEHVDWLCRKGCDSCCRHLADVPLLTETEWHLLRQGLAALAPDLLPGIRAAMTVLADSDVRPVVCPLLDPAAGACRVYLHRPVACRSYGFFVQRELGLYCGDIEASVARGELTDVVWGNHDAIDRRLTELGEKRSMPAWFLDWANST